MRLMLLSDAHPGHITGLTPPDYWRNAAGGNSIFAKQRAQQKERWEWFAAEIDKVKKEKGADHVVFNGDAVDGASTKIGGAEMSETLQTQIDMSKQIISFCKSDCTKEVHMISGTNYHTRTRDGSIDLEKIISDQIGAHYSPIAFLNVGSSKRPFIIKCRHHTAKGSIIGGGAIPGAVRQMVSSILSEKLMGDPAVDMIVLSHVHEASFVQMFQADGSPLYVLTTPGLQGRGSEYGMKMCSGVVHFGFVVLDITPTSDGGHDVVYQPHIAQLKSDMTDVYDCA